MNLWRVEPNTSVLQKNCNIRRPRIGTGNKQSRRLGNISAALEETRHIVWLWLILWYQKQCNQEIHKWLPGIRYRIWLHRAGQGALEGTYIAQNRGAHWSTMTHFFLCSERKHNGHYAVLDSRASGNRGISRWRWIRAGNAKTPGKNKESRKMV